MSALPGAVRARLSAGRLGAMRAVASTGPWPVGRCVRAAAAAAVAVAVARWAVTADPALSGLFELPALGGLGMLAAGLAGGRERLLAAGVALLTLAVALAVAATSPPAGTAAALGAGLVAVVELSRWSVERRVEPAREDAAERRRWLHLAGTLGAGWLLGSGAVAVAAGRLGGSVWRVALAAVAVIAVAAVIASAARSSG